MLTLFFIIYYSFVVQKSNHYKITKEIILLNFVIIILNEIVFNSIFFILTVKDVCKEKNDRKKLFQFVSKENSEVEEIWYKKQFTLKVNKRKKLLKINSKGKKHKNLMSCGSINKNMKFNFGDKKTNYSPNNLNAFSQNKNSLPISSRRNDRKMKY